jgi:hypothetical protein
LTRGSPGSRGPDETGDRVHDTAHITTCVGRRSSEETLTGLLNKIRLFNFTFCGILRPNKILIIAVRLKSHTINGRSSRRYHQSELL